MAVGRNVTNKDQIKKISVVAGYVVVETWFQSWIWDDLLY